MVFKELEIQGFKSFPDKVKITFDAGVTGVIQSSAASVGIIQALSLTGQVTYTDVTGRNIHIRTYVAPQFKHECL